MRTDAVEQLFGARSGRLLASLAEPKRLSPKAAVQVRAVFSPLWANFNSTRSFPPAGGLDNLSSAGADRRNSRLGHPFGSN